MGERTRRPPAGPPLLCRPGMVMNGSDRNSLRADEESVREEQGHLRASVSALRREGVEIRERLRNAEKESTRKDKQLHDLLAGARCGNGVTGEVLDQVREDLQALLQYKRSAQDARAHLEDKELKVAAIQQELKATRIFQMEQDVEQAKLEAKTKANDWAEANSGDHDTHCYTMSQRYQHKAKDLLSKLAASEKETSATLQRLTTLQDEALRLEKATEEHREQIERLVSKRSEIEDQHAQCVKLMETLAELPEKHAKLKLECEQQQEELNRARQEGVTSRLRAASPSSNAWEVTPGLILPGFRLMRRSPSAAHSALLWRIRHALDALNVSGIDLLAAEDLDKDGRVTAHELYTALQPLKIRECDLAAVDGLVSAIGDSLPGATNGYIAIVDFVLALPLEPPPPGPADAELDAVFQAIAWAGCRRKLSEAEMRRQFVEALQDPSCDLSKVARDVCNQLGLDDKTARQLGMGLEARRESIALFIWPWCSEEASVAASVLGRFLIAVATHREAMDPALASAGDAMNMTKFLEMGSLLGPKWSQDDLRIVALQAELPLAAGPGAPPMVDGAKLRRAAGKGCFAQEFADAASHCTNEMIAKLDSSASQASRKLPSASWAPKPAELSPVRPIAVAVEAPAAAVPAAAALEITPPAVEAPNARSPPQPEVPQPESSRQQSPQLAQAPAQPQASSHADPEESLSKLPSTPGSRQGSRPGSARPRSAGSRPGSARAKADGIAQDDDSYGEDDFAEEELSDEDGSDED